MNRRNFLGVMTAATATAALSRKLSWAADDHKTGDHKIEKIGIQLYTLRDLFNQDFEGTLAKLAAIGYRELELTSSIKAPAMQQKAAFVSHGLTAPSTHKTYQELGDRWPATLEDCKFFGCRYVVIPGVTDEIHNQPDGYKIAAETFNHAGEISKQAGIQLCFHNHWAEFVPNSAGDKPIDVLLKYGDPQLLKIEMDLGWASVAGIDPLKYFAKYPGRFPLVHVKDFKKLPTHDQVYGGGHFDGDETIADMTAVGSGIVDWKRIFAHAEQAGIKHYFVEHDQPTDGLQVARDSYAYLAKLRF
jgi:sugar phosphate isomerase/epimerase